MNSSRPPHAAPNPSIRTWASIVALFACASGAQVLMYARPLWGGGPIWAGLPSPMYLPLVLAFFFGPGLVAAVLALGVLWRHSPPPGVPSLSSVITVVVFAILSCYVGVLISFNTWGT